MKNNIKIGFIGAGNMTKSLVAGLIDQGHNKNLISVSAPNASTLVEVEKMLDVETSVNNSKIAVNKDVLVLAVKPQVIQSVVAELSNVVAQECVIISIAVGIKDLDIRNFGFNKMAIVRCIPNVASLVRASASGLYANKTYISNEQKNTAESIMRAVGQTVWVDKENELDIIAALSGSGPAYLFRIMECMELAAVKMGLSQATAHLLTLQTVFGAAKISTESGIDITELRKSVATKGGITEKALEMLDKYEIENAFYEALLAGKNRSDEIGAICTKI